MDIILGIDIGGSTTKITGFPRGPGFSGAQPEGGNPPRMGQSVGGNPPLMGRSVGGNPPLMGRSVGELLVKASDQATSVYGSLGHFTRTFGFALGDITSIALTGVGASFFHEKIYGVPTVKIDEFKAIGYGGLLLAGLDEAFVISMGTGTAFVRATPEGVRHIGGSGVGGGTLLGLSGLLLNKRDIEAVVPLARDGRSENVDLLVKDIIDGDIPSLPPNLTAANFGNVKSTASGPDVAVGVINLIIQTIGMLAAFASKNDPIKDFILTGALTTLPDIKDTFDAIGQIHGIRFILPPNAVYATATGAAYAAQQNAG